MAEKRFRVLRQDLGFTLVQLILVLALMAIMTAMAAPPVASWRNRLYYRQAANQIAVTFRYARGLAVSKNRQHMVVINPSSGSYTVIRGSTAYNPIITGFVNSSTVQSSLAPSQTYLKNAQTDQPMKSTKIIFNPNGTALLDFNDPAYNGGEAVLVYDTKGNKKYSVSVMPTGRITVTQATATTQ